MPADHPIFGRDVPDAAWRPTPELLRDARLARFLRATGEPDLEALQARAVADPGWFWGAAADDLGVAWQRRPDAVARPGERRALGRWWVGGAFNHAVASVEPRAAADPDGEALAWEGEDGEVRRLTNAELRERSTRPPGCSRAQGVGRGRSRRDLPADARRDGHRGPRARPARGDLHADLLGLRRAGRRDPARAMRGVRPGHRRRVPPPRRAVPHEGRRGRGRGAAPSVRRVLVVRRLGRPGSEHAVERRTRPLVGRGDRDGGRGRDGGDPDAAAPAAPTRTPRRRT